MTIAGKLKDPREYLERKSEKVTETGCWIWMGSVHGSNDYGFAFVNWQHYRAHRLSWIAFRGPIPDGMLVCHACDISLCVNPAHLFLGTHADNMRDMTTKQRQARGARHGSAKLTDEQVLAIRAAEGKQRDIAKQFGIGKSLVHVIKSRQAWRHV